jgi:hypothetical protein
MPRRAALDADLRQSVALRRCHFVLPARSGDRRGRERQHRDSRRVYRGTCSRSGTQAPLPPTLLPHNWSESKPKFGRSRTSAQQAPWSLSWPACLGLWDLARLSLAMSWIWLRSRRRSQSPREPEAERSIAVPLAHRRGCGRSVHSDTVPDRQSGARYPATRACGPRTATDRILFESRGEFRGLPGAMGPRAIEGTVA